MEKYDPFPNFQENMMKGWGKGLKESLLAFNLSSPKMFRLPYMVHNCSFT
jgi:hypothetical protein